MRLIIAQLILGGLAGISLVLFIAASHQYFDAQASYEDARVERLAAQAQREAADAQRRATETQRAVVEAIGEHMQEWLKARCGART